MNALTKLMLIKYYLKLVSFPFQNMFFSEMAFECSSWCMFYFQAKNKNEKNL